MPDSALPPPDQCWRAVTENDAAYDGAFVFAVRTTRIYCRPSCRSRRPNRENVRFFALPQAAEQAGYRPCKRCQPHLTAPTDPAAQAVRKICRIIAADPAERHTLADLGARVHLSPTHLQRTFKALMGITPRQYADACRSADLKANLRAGHPVTRAAVEAGYSSSSRLHAHSQKYLGMSPSAYQAGGAAMTVRYALTESPLGWLLIASTERGVCQIALGDEAAPLVDALCAEFPAADCLPDDDALAAAVAQVLAYLRGWQPHIDLPLDLRVTAFQQRVLDELRRIPYGETRTYGEVARAVGSPKAARAVGQVCNMNPVPLLIPCHRVLRSDGNIRGYAFGDARKRQLLELEQRQERCTSENRQDTPAP